MEYTIPLQDIADAWTTALQENEAIRSYCRERYGKLPVILNGGNPRESPDGDYCPYIVVMNGSKIEGDDQSVLSYTMGIAWAVKNAGLVVDGQDQPNGYYTGAGRIELKGARECDELGQLIYEAVQTEAVRRGWPISRIDYDVTPVSTFPQFAGTMICITEIEPALGETLAY